MICRNHSTIFLQLSEVFHRTARLASSGNHTLIRHRCLSKGGMQCTEISPHQIKVMSPSILYSLMRHILRCLIPQQIIHWMLSALWSTVLNLRAARPDHPLVIIWYIILEDSINIPILKLIVPGIWLGQLAQLIRRERQLGDHILLYAPREWF